MHNFSKLKAMRSYLKTDYASFIQSNSITLYEKEARNLNYSSGSLVQ